MDDLDRVLGTQAAAAPRDPDPRPEHKARTKPKKRGTRGKGEQSKSNPKPEGATISNSNSNNPQADAKPAKGKNKQQAQAKKAKSENKSHQNKKNPSTHQSSSNKDNNKNRQSSNKTPYPSYWDLGDCLHLYAVKDPTLVRGKIRVLPAKDAKAFVSCDRGQHKKDILVATELEQNRALDGDIVFVELSPPEETQSMEELTKKIKDMSPTQTQSQPEEKEEAIVTWQDDEIQQKLWNPTVSVRRVSDNRQRNEPDVEQRKGKVVYVVPPKETAGTQPSELDPTDTSHRHRAPRRTIVGTMNRMARRQGDLYFLTPSNKSLPQFLCPTSFRPAKRNGKESEGVLYKAEYEYGTWQESHRWPSCVNVVPMGKSCNVEDETLALLVENDVNHGDFPSAVLKDVDMAVESGLMAATDSSSQELGWRPTPEMYQGRRDYRKQRIFTIDPTTAKDLDDALHITKLPDGRVEIGVHIADVSHFVRPGSAVDQEAMHRATTVYLVDRTVPMLPRPLCEVACSLNENVERLAFSCVWRMNMDGTLGGGRNASKGDEVWYGRTVIKSCARLDYSTAQNIIENKIANGEQENDVDTELWPVARRPTGGHTIDQVAADVRLMHRVAVARRRLRFQNGAIALNGIKLAFQLDSDGETPMLCAPYPIRDSNRLVEEYMLMANYLTAQRLISHSYGLALLRHHPPPLMDGIDKVVQVADVGMGFHIDATSSQTLQASLNRLGRECTDELVMQCVTEMLTAPMKPAEYVAAGEISEEDWRHFALNIPYYTHFTSPIRRYADVVVHRLLQATIDGEESVKSFPMSQHDIQSVSTHCNEKRMGSKKAQERSDRVFLALYLKKHPLKSELGVVLSVGEKTFSVFLPSLGASVKLFLDDHKDMLTYEPFSRGDERRIRLVRKNNATNGGGQKRSTRGWTEIEIKVFTKLKLSCVCKEKPPIDVKILLEGPWKGR